MALPMWEPVGDIVRSARMVPARPSISPTCSVSWRAIPSALDRAIAQLPPGYRTVFVLHDVEGHEHEEIARMLGVAVGTSKSQLHKARMKLRTLINQQSALN